MARDATQLHYAESHEWVDVEQTADGPVATVGISKFAITALNDLVYMELPKVGRKLTAGEEFGEVESVKSVNSLYSPIAGEVVAVHAELPDNLEQLGTDPYDFGWIMKVKLDGALPSSLMDHAAYEKQCAEAG